MGRGGRGGIDGPHPDMMELVLGTDVANMQDVSDFMTDGEINQWEVKRKVLEHNRLQDFLMQTPAMQSCLNERTWDAIMS